MMQIAVDIDSIFFVEPNNIILPIIFLILTAVAMVLQLFCQNL